MENRFKNKELAVAFGTPFSGNSLDKKLSIEEFARTIRFSISAEFEAIQLYGQIKDAFDNEEAKKLIQSIIDEEKIHVGEWTALLEKFSPKDIEKKNEGEKEAKKTMSDKKLLASTFMDYAANATTEIIEIADDNLELIEAAKKFNIAIPSPDFAVLKTIYAEVDVPNRNGAILPKDAVLTGLPTLIGKQCNWNHEGANQICGYIIDAKLEENFIVVYAVIFKSLFPEEMAQLKDEFAKKDLAVSFEIWSKNPETGNSVVTEDRDGNRIINPIIFHGCGILINEEPPACPNAYAKKLYAMFTVNKLEEMDNLVFASLNSKKECFQCAKCTGEKGEKMGDDIVKIGNPGVNMPEVDNTQFENDYAWAPCEDAKKMTKEQRDALKDEDFAKVLEFKNANTGEPKKVRIFPIHDETHVAVSYSALKNDKMKELMTKYGIDSTEIESKILDMANKFKMAEYPKGANYKNDTVPVAKGSEFYWKDYEDDVDENLIPEEEYDEEFMDGEKLTYKQRKGLDDSDFAVVIHKDGKTIRKYPIKDEAHVRNALSRLGNDKAKETLKNLGVSVEEVKGKILHRAKELNMTELVKKHEAAQATEPVQETTVVPDVKPEEAKATPEETLKAAEVTPEVAAEPEVVPAPSNVKVDRTITEETKTEICTYGENGHVEEEKTHRKVTTIFSDGHQDVLEEDVMEVEKFSCEQLNAAVNKAVSEKETEIQTLKAELETVKASKESEISSLKKEVTDKDIEIASFKKQKEEEPSLEIGSAEITPVDREDIVEKAAREVEELSAKRNKKLLKK